MTTIVVYVHGLWFTGREGFLLRRRVCAELGAVDHAFSYASVTGSIADNAAALGAYLSKLRADTIHLVGHSLGGVVILELFENPPSLPPGRIVLLGSPLNGSRAARNFARLPFARRLLGRSIEDAVLQTRPRHWSGVRELGVIAGARPLGLGRLVGLRGEPNDGTVAVAETALLGATDQIVLPVSHSSMVFSAAVVGQAVSFLRAGRFQR